MDTFADTIIDEGMPRARLACFEAFLRTRGDAPWRVMYPLQEVLLLVTCPDYRFVR